MGQLLNALSELLIDKLSNRLWGAHIVRNLRHPYVGLALEKEFSKDIFDYLKHDYRRTFCIIEAIVDKNMPDSAITAKRFIALAVMFQSVALALMLVVVSFINGYIKGHIFSESILTLFLVLILILILIVLLFWSYRRYKNLWALTVSMSFVAWVQSKNDAN